MLKNWIVKTKQIKNKESGFINHVNYLKSDKKASHKHSRIVILNDAADNILKEIDNRRLHRQKNSITGGGVSNYATSFVVSLPTDIKQPTDEEWKQIGLYGIKKIAKAIGVDYSDLKAISHIVLHNEADGDNKASHIHILVGNVLDNKVIKGVSQLKATFALKNSVNYSVKQLLNEDNKKYMPKEKGKNVPNYIAKAQKLMTKITNWLNTIRNREDSYKQVKEFKETLKEIDNKLTEKVKDDIYNIAIDAENEQALNNNILQDFEKLSPIIEQIPSKRKRRRRI